MKAISQDGIRRRRPKFMGTPQNGEPKEGMDRYYSRTIERALDVLEAFPDSNSKLSLTEVSELTKLAESSVFRMLLTLESRGYLRQSGDGTYHLSPKVLRGKIYEKAERLRDLVHPKLEELSRQFNETVGMAYFFDPHIQVVDCIHSLHDIHVRNKVGRVLAPHASSLGKAITAFQDANVIDKLLEIYGLYPKTKNTVVDRQLIYADFSQIRNNGYAFDREETSEGIICTGAPIFSRPGMVDASISISVPLIRMNEQLQVDIINSLLAAAQEVQKALS